LAPIQNILLIRIRAFGDTLLTTPTLRGLKAAYPEARLTVLVEPAMGVILQGLPYVDEILHFDRLGSKGKGVWHELKSNLAFWRLLRERHFDLVVDVLGTPRTAWMTWISAAPIRVGFAFRIRRWAYTNVWQPSPKRKYIADYTADTLRALGKEPDSLKLDFVVPPASKAFAAAFFRQEGWEDGRVLMVQGAGGWDLKRYPEDQLAAALRQIRQARGLPICYLWGPGEAPMAERLKALVGSGSLAPPTDFASMGALLENAALLITNDNATKHLAVALNCPTVTIFGPTSDVAWHPPRDPRHKCPSRLALHALRGLDLSPGDS
jgi:heptosyltransferase-3